ncbi:MAG: FG-GAP-like repeat-containing protein, partial [Bacteroidota bacterium]
GDLDLVTNNVNQEAFVFQNRSENSGNHYLRVELEGSGQNTFAIGATVTVHRGEEVLTTEVIPTRGFQSSIAYPAIFGLGDDAAVDSVHIVWPDRTESTVVKPAVDAELLIRYGEVPRKQLSADQIPSAGNHFFVSANLSLAAHEEDEYLDQLQEGLVIRSLTNEGPEVVSGDLNGDGLPDLFIGGARYQPAQLYFQQGGELVRQDQAILRQISETEDTGITLFDADGDGDQDIFLGSGGNFTGANSPFLGDKLLFNDGEGNFSMRSGVLPRYAYNTSVAVALDYDGDGDQDLFVGTRSKPQDYAALTVSFLLKNDGAGNFQDVTKEVAPIFATLGMVTDALFASLTEPGTRVLAVVSEWGAPRFFAFNGQQFEEQQTTLADYPGWWYAIETADLDGDGDQDLLLGNRGENFYFSADSDHPAKLWVADFDGNGRTEKIITQHLSGRDMPMTMKRNLTAELPNLKKSVLKHQDYAQKSIKELFSREALQKARVFEATYFKSIVAINNGGGDFSVQPLPSEVQLSCICDINCKDLNGDGTLDLIMGGNFSGFLPQFSRLDASYGHVLLNDGKGAFSIVPNVESGFTVKGDLKDITTIDLGGTEYLVATVNDQMPKVFRIKTSENE